MHHSLNQMMVVEILEALPLKCNLVKSRVNPLAYYVAKLMVNPLECNVVPLMVNQEHQYEPY